MSEFEREYTVRIRESSGGREVEVASQGYWFAGHGDHTNTIELGSLLKQAAGSIFCNYENAKDAE